MENTMKLYPSHVHLLPLASRYVTVGMPDGTRWAIPVATILDGACRYYERNGWDDPDDLKPGEKQPTGEELRGIVEVNADMAQEACELRWDRVEDDAVLLSGPGTIPPGNDELWWFKENGGTFKERTTILPDQQMTRSGGPLLDDYAMGQWVERASEQERRHDLLTYFRT